MSKKTDKDSNWLIKFNQKKLIDDVYVATLQSQSDIR